MAEDTRTEQERVLDMGREAAEENVKNEDTRTRENDEKTFEKNIKASQDLAQANHEVEHGRQEDRIQDVIPANDTSKSAKQATAKSQLDPNGDDPISATEINKSATDASMETGNKTAVDDAEVSKRAANPGEAETNGPRALSNPDRNDEQNDTVEKVSEASTTNRDQARAGEERRTGAVEAENKAVEENANKTDGDTDTKTERKS